MKGNFNLCRTVILPFPSSSGEWKSSSVIPSCCSLQLLWASETGYCCVLCYVRRVRVFCGSGGYSGERNNIYLCARRCMWALWLARSHFFSAFFLGAPYAASIGSFVPIASCLLEIVVGDK